MNLLKEIDVIGNLFPTHGRISMKFSFHNPTNHPLSPTYFFPLPKDASITGMQLLTKDKILLRADIVSTADVSVQSNGFRLVQIDPQLYSLTWECLPAGDTCTIILECLFRLLPYKGRCRLTIPLGLPTNPSWEAASPCPVNFDLTLRDMSPAILSPQDSFDSNTGIFSTTALTSEDYVLDLTLHNTESCGYLQEELGKGYGFTRLFFPVDRLEHQPQKKSVVLALDISHATTLREGNALKELFFRASSAIPDGISVRYITDSALPPALYTKDELYQHLQELPAGVGEPELLLQTITEHPSPDSLVILISDNTHIPSELPDFPVILLTTGAICPAALSHHLSGMHLHFYPKDNSEEILSSLLPELLSPYRPVEIIPEGSSIHDCFIHPYDFTLSEGYLDVAFSYTGKAPLGFTLWQNSQKKLTCPMPQSQILPRYPDAEQLYATTKIQNLTTLLEKVSPVSRRSIKTELAILQREFRILGTETALSIAGTGETSSSIPTGFYSAGEATPPLANRPTIFGEGVRSLPKTEREQLVSRCRAVVYNAIRSNGAIRSPLGITPQMSAEETALSYLALFADGNADTSILQDALTYLSSAPETPWDFLIHSNITKESLQKILPSIPPFETLLASLGDNIPLITADYLLLWLSLI